MDRLHYSQISYAIDGPAAVITLNRPDRLNALDRPMVLEIIDAFNAAEENDNVRAIIMTGSGRAFCAGAHLATDGDTFKYAPNPGGGPPRDGGGMLSLRIFECSRPTIAAINGSAVGLGISMTLPMDFRLLAEHSKVGFVFAGRGIVPDAASTWFLPRIVGINQALEWVLTARVFRAQEALSGGLVRSIHAADDVLQAAHELVAEIAANTAPVSAAVSRGLLWHMLASDHPMNAHRAESDAIFTLGRSPDAREGVSAFLEKRSPSWALRPSRDLPGRYPYWQQPTY